jgi:hypothetical protein
MRKPRVTCCDNFFIVQRGVRCNGRFCDGCVVRHYGEDPATLMRPSWFCYRCDGRCSCAACRRKRNGEDIGLDLEGPGPIAHHPSTPSASMAQPLTHERARPASLKRFGGNHAVFDGSELLQPVKHQVVAKQQPPPPALVSTAAPSPTSFIALARLAEESLRSTNSSLSLEQRLCEQEEQLKNLRAMFDQMQQEQALLLQISLQQSRNFQQYLSSYPGPTQTNPLPNVASTDPIYY